MGQACRELSVEVEYRDLMAKLDILIAFDGARSEAEKQNIDAEAMAIYGMKVADLRKGLHRKGIL